MILVIGATGNIGKHVVASLVEKGVEVRALTRQAHHARTLLPASIDIVEGDLTDADTAARVLRGVDKVYLATNGNDSVVAETTLIRAARAARVQQIVKVSVIGATPQNFVVLAQAHAAIEQELRAADIPATILRPNWFMENFFGAADTIKSQGATYGSAGDGKVAFVDSRDTAAVAVMALLGKGHEGKEYQITGPEALTFAEAAQRIGKGIGRQVAYVNLSDENFQAALLGAGLPAQVAEIFLQINRNAREGNLAQVTNTVAELTGAPARSLEAFAHDYQAVFAPDAK